MNKDNTMTGGATDNDFDDLGAGIRTPINQAMDKAKEIGRNAQGAAADMASAATDAVKSQASDLKVAAQGLAAEAGDRLQREVDDRKNAGADYVSNLARTVRRAADDIEGDAPLAASYIQKAADQIDAVSQAVRERDVADLVNEAQTFARNQPTVFLGLSVLAGFAAVRFVKSVMTTGENATQSSEEEEDDTMSYRGPSSGSRRPGAQSAYR